ncbi:mitochondrial transcription rescue factor 1 [Leptidea sinapis]|uniref:mitochondrial transcription rescue factor 1 n=1 Tax=Leptidea sinapis TaxID=189913 RepID=UPI00213DD9AD|nr:mitochondrial transcription rescue factor 1 [Leptidea sinapis]
MNALWRRSVISARRIIFNNYCNKQSILFNNFCSLQTLKPNNITVNNVTYSIIRQKSKKQRDIDSDDEEEFDEGDKSLSKDSKVIKLNTTSLRADGILKLGLGVSRNKIEQFFYESKIRLNGKKLLKKSTSIRIDDEVDLIKGFSPKNPEHILISRIEVLNIAAKEESISVTVRRFKNLLIENYEQDPYKKSSTDDEE